MKLVLDTNIYISAFLSNGIPRAVLKRCVEGEDVLYASHEIINELENVLRRPKLKISKETGDYFLRQVADLAIFVPVDNSLHGACRDAADDKILECAQNIRADYIITGDDDLLDLQKFADTRICTAAEYMQIVAQIIN